jgi:hypothetical protein
MRPGYYPWHLSEREAIFLTHSLDQARLVATRLQEDAGWLDSPKKNHYLVRVPLGGDDVTLSGTEACDLFSPPGQQLLFRELGGNRDRGWSSEWRTPAPLVQAPLPPYPLDEVRLQRLKNSCRTRGGIWEIDAFYTPSPIDGEPAKSHLSRVDQLGQSWAVLAERQNGALRGPTGDGEK